MNRIKRYCTALGRFNRSKGYGVHSPFAFHFIRNVLRENCPYYAYNEIKEHRKRAKILSPKKEKQLNVISFKGAKMLFRIACFFSPETILQIGTSHGVSTATLLKVSRLSKVILYPGENNNDNVYQEITRQYTNRIFPKSSINEAITTYNAIDKQCDFILINHIEAKELSPTTAIAMRAINNGGVVIIRNLAKSPATRLLWKTCCHDMQHGMSFSNLQSGIIVGYKHLPKQHFKLWF